jgi:hypothetical protein
VSPWSTDALHVHCGPEGALALTRVGWRKRFGEARHYARPAGEPRWAAAAEGAAAALADFPGKPVRVVLANRLLQFRIMPWRDDLPGDDEYRALAQLEFASAFGSLAEGWTIALSDEAPGQARIAAAVPGELLAAIRASATAQRTRVTGVRPALTIAAGFWSSVEAALQWLVVAEPGQLCFVARDASGWRWLRQTRVGADWAARLPELLDEEARLSRLDFSREMTRVFAPEANRDELATLQQHGFAGLELAPQPDFPAEGDIKFITAWCA